LKTNFISHLFFLFYSLFQLIHLSSCKKNNNGISQPVIIQGKDSSLLIKSIEYAANTIETYEYDSINNKIIFTSKRDDGVYIQVTRSELSYNDNHLLTGIIKKFKPDNSPDTNIILSVKIEYDDQSILKKIDVRDFYGSIKSTLFNKTLPAPGKYELSWPEPGAQLPDGTRITQTLQAVFNDSGQLISKLDNYPYSATGVPGDTSTTAAITKDSLVYDNQGSVVKVLTNYVDTFNNINDSFTHYQFTSRVSKGDNLYNQRQLLMRGISNIPFGLYVLSGEAGVLSIFNGIEALEYTRYPFQTVAIHIYRNNDDVSFKPLSEFDNKGRLTYFKGFRMDDVTPYSLDYRITYYK
jgi:hypothetical protein